MLYFNSFCVQNLDPEVNCFGIAMFLRWMRGGAQDHPHQHPISNEAADVCAVQWKAVAVCGFTWEAQKVQEVAGNHCWVQRTNGSILLAHHWGKMLDTAIPRPTKPTLSLKSLNRKPRIVFTFLPKSFSRLHSEKAQLTYCTTPGSPNTRPVDGAEGAGQQQCTCFPWGNVEMCYVFGLVSHASCHMYVIKSVSKKALHMDYLTFMWHCKYSYVVSSFPLTKIYCMETE